MSDAFDPYRKWLGIPPAEQPPHHYRLLGIGLYEDDPDVIESAADQRMAHLRTFQAGPHSALSQKLLNEIVVAKICLLSPDQRAAYDIELRQRLSPPEAAVERPMPAAAPVAVAPFGEDLLETAIASIPASQPLAPRTRGRAKGGQPLVWWLAGAGGLFALVVAALVVFSRPAPPAAAEGGAEPPATKPNKPVEVNVVKVNAAAKPAPPKVSPGALEPPPAVAPFDAKQARAHQEAWATYLKTPLEQTNSLGMSLVLIPPGEFMMGSTPEQIAAARRFAEQAEGAVDKWTLERLAAEAPAHRVKISKPFLLGATEVTIGQFRRFIEATSYVTETEQRGGGSSTSQQEQDPRKKSLTWRTPNFAVNDQSPVGEITWNDAVAFCNWLSDVEKRRRCYTEALPGVWELDREGDGYRLPTEAEWEFACRSGTTTQYSFGDDAELFGEYGWSEKARRIEFPIAAGSKKPNNFGLYDMHGTADEWCHDWYSANYYAGSPTEDPTGPASGDARMRRGAGWNNPLVWNRSAFRGSYPPFWRFGGLCFRVLRVSAAASSGAAQTAATLAASASNAAAAAPGPAPAVAPFDVKQARAHQEAWAAHLQRKDVEPNSIGMPMVLIPPGEFTMGSTAEQIAAAGKLAEEADENAEKWYLARIALETPAHRVKISRPFLMSATEVAVGHYRRFVDATSYVTETERFGGGDSTKKDEQDPNKKNSTWRAAGKDDAAVRHVTWADAAAFCNWLSDQEKKNRCYRQDTSGEWLLEAAADGYRLPTEAEWEYACRAGTTTQYSFGDDVSKFGEYGWSAKAGQISHPVAVGSKIPNAFGLYDMHGNVDEWCHDWFAADFYRQSPETDPICSAPAEGRVRRGGGWDLPIARCRSAFRDAYAPHWRFHDLGFRVVCVSAAASARLAAPEISEGTPAEMAQPKRPGEKPRSSADLAGGDKSGPAKERQDRLVAEEAFTLNQHAGAVTRVAFHPGLPLLASAGKDGRVLLWDLEKRTLIEQFDRFKEEVWTVKFSPNGEALSYANRYHWGSVVPFKTVNGAKEINRLKDFKFGGGAVGSIAYSPDGAFFAAGQDDGTIRLWDTAAFQEIAPLSVGGNVNSLVFGPIVFDRKRKPSKYLLAAGCADGSVKTLDLSLLKEKSGPRWTFAANAVEFPKPAGVLCARFSPDGKQLASGRRGGLISLFNPETAQTVRDLKASNANVEWISFHPERPWLVAAHGADRQARVWNYETGETLCELPVQAAAIYCAEFSRDGRQIATGSEDFSIKVWNLKGLGIDPSAKRLKKGKAAAPIVGD